MIKKGKNEIVRKLLEEENIEIISDFLYRKLTTEYDERVVIEELTSLLKRLGKE